ncbi:alcohol dehydrogenase GroES-like domain protein [Mycobacterium kansasii 732]|nr:alcohol dehydrogenase GroES-like domain protein [Mycobacterium kansasii 732]
MSACAPGARSRRPPLTRWGRSALPTLISESYGSKMKRVVVPRYGGPEVLSVVEEDQPVPGPGQVSVRVLAAGVSFTDTLLRAGTYPGGPKPPFTPGYEFAGVVERIGPGCSTLVRGDRVAALVVRGGYAEIVCVAESLAIKVPDDVDPAVLVSVIFPYLTAYQLIHRAAKAQPGATVLYHGAAGRVGVALLELAKPADLRVYGTASTADCACRATRRCGDRLHPQGFSPMRARAARRRGRRRARWNRRIAVVSFSSRIAARRSAGALRPLLDRCPRTPHLARFGSVLRLGGRCRAWRACLA